MNMKYKPTDLQGALNALADTLGIVLKMSGKTPFAIDGEGIQASSVFDTDLSIPIRVNDSFVDTTRGVILLDTSFGAYGNLGMILLADSEALKMSTFVIDRTKIVKDIILPIFWVRQRLYETICPALKATYEKAFYDRSWRLKERGNDWMKEYLADKKAAQKNAAVQAAAQQLI